MPFRTPQTPADSPRGTTPGSPAPAAPVPPPNPYGPNHPESQKPDDFGRNPYHPEYNTPSVIPDSEAPWFNWMTPQPEDFLPEPPIVQGPPRPEYRWNPDSRQLPQLFPNMGYWHSPQTIGPLEGEPFDNGFDPRGEIGGRYGPYEPPRTEINPEYWDQLPEDRWGTPGVFLDNPMNRPVPPGTKPIGGIFGPGQIGT